jgi:hypothetical protein
MAQEIESSCNSSFLLGLAQYKGYYYSTYYNVCNIVCQEDFEVIVVVARSLWLLRNFFVHGGAFEHPNQTVREAMESLQGLQRSPS